ncbi:hypothetical protein TNCT_634171, partial [Trichonephila clavata]
MTMRKVKGVDIGIGRGHYGPKGLIIRFYGRMPHKGHSSKGLHLEVCVRSNNKELVLV